MIFLSENGRPLIFKDMGESHQIESSWLPVGHISKSTWMAKGAGKKNSTSRYFVKVLYNWCCHALEGGSLAEMLQG